MDIVEEAVKVLESGDLLGAITNNNSSNVTVAVVETEAIYVQEQCHHKDPQQWLWRAPADLPQPLGPVDLAFMLRTIDYATLQTAPQSLIVQLGELSQTLNELRLGMCQNTQALYVYGYLLRHLGTRFDNSNVKCRAYFKGNSLNSTSNLYGEYVQTLVLLTMRHYSAACDMPDGKPKAALLDRAYAAMHEACETAQLLQSERYEAERRLRRWQYIKPPSSVSQHNVQEKAERLEAFRREDTTRLRSFVRQELGGLAQLGAHAILMQLQKNEMRARDLEQIVLSDVSAGHALVYEQLAPIIEAVLLSYDAITAQLQNKPQAALGLYAAQQRLYWHTKQQYLMASVDWAYYRQSGSEVDALGYGMRALQRLKQLSEGDVSPHIVAVVQALLDEVEAELGGYSLVAALDITAVEAFVAPQAPPPHAVYAEEAWLEYVRERPVVAQALEALHGFHTCCVEAVSRQQSLRRVGARDVDPSFEMSNACMAAVLNDRHTTLLPWLLKKRRDDGTIILSVEQVAHLQLEYEEVKQQMQRNGMFIAQ